jgi:hypothetical protein
MESKKLSHLHRNLIVCFALTLVLAGTAFASVKVSQRLTAGVTCGGHCPASTVYWAYVCADCGQNSLLGAGPNVIQTALGGVPASVYHQQTGVWVVHFSGRDLTNCARFANLTSIRGSATVAGYSSANPETDGVTVLTTNAAGQPFDADFVIGVFCGGGLGANTESEVPGASGAGA